jgi:hypothetical protein
MFVLPSEVEYLALSRPGSFTVRRAGVEGCAIPRVPSCGTAYFDDGLVVSRGPACVGVSDRRGHSRTGRLRVGPGGLSSE